MAVYTAVSDKDLETFLYAYDIGRAISLKGISEGVENSNYFLQTEKGFYILTLYEKRVDHADLPYFLGLMEHLAKRSIACPTPIHGQDGKILRQLCGRPAAITSFLSGVSPLNPRELHCRPLGIALAKMHVAGLDYPAFRKNSLSFEGWRALFLQVKDNADTVQEGLAEDIEKELDTLHKIWPTDLPTGIIHADLFPDNVFFDYENLSGLIDFYFACNDFFAYDFAVCLNAWCFQSSAEFNRNKARLLFSGYQTVRRFDEAEIQLLPLLARGAALRFLLTRLYDWLNKSDGALVNPKDPLEFLGKLHFHRNCKGPEDYGIRDI